MRAAWGDAAGMETQTDLVPLLVVRNANLAIDFYVRALGARVLARYEHGPKRHVSHAELVIGASAFAVTEEARAWNSDAPESLGGTPVVLQLGVDDVDAAFRALLDEGARVVFPVHELLGERMGRVRDPFGHLWLLRQRLQELPAAEIQRQRDALFAKATSTLNDGPAAPQAQTPRAHLVVGPVGAGKSTHAQALAREHRALRLTLDAWMVELFRPDRPDSDVVGWYRERAARSVEQIWKVARDALELGTSVVLEIGLLDRAARESFYVRLDEAGVAWTVHVLNAPRQVRRQRVQERNRKRGPTFSMVVPPDVFEFASDLWEPPDPDECEDRDVRLISTWP
jgi:uncharacterized glyoxalase superfamily protein PhnB/predicted kinase